MIFSWEYKNEQPYRITEPEKASRHHVVMPDAFKEDGS